MSYDSWINAVDKILLNVVGLCHDDMEDYLWHDEWEAGAKPAEAAEDFLIECGYYAE